MKKEEDPFDFLDNVAKLNQTPVHHMAGYVPPEVVLTEEELVEQAAQMALEKERRAEESRIFSLAEERQLLQDDPHNFVRSKIKQQVQDVMWLDLLRDQMQARSLEEEVDDRCVICTLPYGHCPHTQEYPEAEQAYSRKDALKDDTDRELDDMLGIMGGSLEIDTKADATEGVDLDTMRWVDLAPAKSDKIGATRFSLSTPPPRGWHTTTYMDDQKLMIVFGGFRFRDTQVPQPFGVAPQDGEVEFLSDLYRYDVVTTSWFASGAGNNLKVGHPNGRYGHCAAAVDADRMLVYGGKGSHGRYLSDTWMYNARRDEWTLVEPNEASPPPSPRCFASCVAVENRVYLFGGTDGVDNFGDLWVFNSQEGAMRWERSIAVGIPPSPRYGHEVVLLSMPGFETSSRICVVGGCSVSPQSEVYGMASTPEETKRMLDLGKALEARYVNEGEVSMLGGQYLQSVTDSADRIGGSSLKDIYRQAAGITSQIFEAETLTRQAEKDLVKAHNLMDASRSVKLQKSKHPNKNIDIFFLDVNEMMWKPQVYPPISGEFPAARMHFGAVSIGGFLILCGGANPTSLQNRCVDQDHQRVYALELRQNVWIQCAPRDTSEYLELPVQIAESDVVRAKARVQLEKDRGKALGARNGMTVELAEAEAVQKVCQWRYNLLHMEMVDMTQPPAPRFGFSFAKYGSRSYLFSGWNAKNAEMSGNFYVLDLEQEHERRRREDDEFHEKLEKDRKNQEARNASADMQSAYELQQMIRAEKVNEAKERMKMVVEDVLSCVPPLMQPKPIRYVKGNQNSMWLEWDRIRTNSVGNLVGDDDIKYNVYMINGYQHFAYEDRVLVMPLAAMRAIELERRIEAGEGDDMSVLTIESTPTKGKGSVAGSKASKSRASRKKMKNDYEDYRGLGFPGEVVGVSKKGFDIAFDDGSFESNVHRTRMKLQHKRQKEGYEEEELTELPDGMSLAEFDKLKEQKRQQKLLLDSLTMPNKESYLIEEEMAFSTKKRIKRKHVVRSEQMIKLNNFKARPSIIRAFDLKNENLLKKIAGVQANALASAKKTQHGSSEVKQTQETQGDDDSDSDQSSVEEVENEEEAQARKLQELFDNGYDRQKYLENLRNQTGRDTTILVHPDWELIYSGSDTQMEVTGLVPLDVVDHDPKLEVPVMFCLQVCGADFPSYEHSQLSEVAEFKTSPDKLALERELELEPLDELDDDRSRATETTAGTPVPSRMFKKEKETFTAVVRGRVVEFEIEKGHTVSGLAYGDYYM
jgi:hypothetical protein